MKAVRRLLVVLAITVAGLATTSAPASAAISVRMEVTKVPQGQWAYAKGKIDVGQKIVFVQRWNGSRWYDITGATVKADGSFRAALKPKDRGIYTFRVRSKSGRTFSPRFYLNVIGPLPDVYYANCDAAWAAGVAPIYRGEPGYRAGLDRDGDGIACDVESTDG